MTKTKSGTNVDEVADGIYRINTALGPRGSQSGFSFNQYLIVDDEPLLFHTGPRRLFRAVHEAIVTVMPLEKLRWIAFGHIEADECGSLNELLALAPLARPLCGTLQTLVSVEDLSDRPPQPIADGEVRSLGTRSVQWLDAPHVPHGWENGLLFEQTTKTLFAGDLFTQPGTGDEPLVSSDILGPSEAFRRQLDYFAHAPQTASVLERLAQTEPRTLACMHGSAYAGDGAALLRALAQSLAPAG